MQNERKLGFGSSCLLRMGALELEHIIRQSNIPSQLSSWFCLADEKMQEKERIVGF